jgi:hypothetical protein
LFQLQRADGARRGAATPRKGTTTKEHSFPRDEKPTAGQEDFGLPLMIVRGVVKVERIANEVPGREFPGISASLGGWNGPVSRFAFSAAGGRSTR